MSTNKERLDKLEKEMRIELDKIAKTEGWPRKPVYDGVVNEDRYLSTSPRMLWILKEAWEEPGKKEYGGWSVTKDIAAFGVQTKKDTYAMVAYITYSVLNGFPSYGEIDKTIDLPTIGDSLKNIALINIKKLSGGTTSNSQEIDDHYRKHCSLLLRQIEVINPSIIIGGSTLHLLFADFGLDRSMFSKLNEDASALYCRHAQRLFIDAYHPAQRGSRELYVDDIVQIIKKDGQNSPAQQPN